jgi:hypothetical protein
VLQHRKDAELRDTQSGRRQMMVIDIRDKPCRLAHRTAVAVDEAKARIVGHDIFL